MVCFLPISEIGLGLPTNNPQTTLQSGNYLFYKFPAQVVCITCIFTRQFDRQDVNFWKGRYPVKNHLFQVSPFFVLVTKLLNWQIRLSITPGILTLFIVVKALVSLICITFWKCMFTFFWGSLFRWKIPHMLARKKEFQIPCQVR